MVGIRRLFKLLKQKENFYFRGYLRRLGTALVVAMGGEIGSKPTGDAGILRCPPGALFGIRLEDEEPQP